MVKTEAEQELVAAIESLAAHRPHLTSRAMEALLAVFLTDARPAKQLLTPRERSVVQLVAEGHSNKQIAPGTQHQREDCGVAPRCDHAQA